MRAGPVKAATGNKKAAHLRNVRKDQDGSFEEAAQLDGDTDMVALVSELLKEETSSNMPPGGMGFEMRVNADADHVADMTAMRSRTSFLEHLNYFPVHTSSVCVSECNNV